MKSIYSGSRLLTAAALFFVASAATAGAPGGTIEYVPMAVPPPVVSAVPTLGEWSLILTALLMTVVAYRALRKRVNGRLLSNLLLAGVLGSMTWTGHGLIQRAQADLPVNDLDMDSPTGGSVMGSSWVRLTNVSGVPLRIKAITPLSSNQVVTPPESPECVVNGVVAVGAKCNILFTYIPENE